MSFLNADNEANTNLAFIKEHLSLLNCDRENTKTIDTSDISRKLHDTLKQRSDKRTCKKQHVNYGHLKRRGTRGESRS